MASFLGSFRAECERRACGCDERLAPGDVMWFGLPNGDGGNPAITAQHVRCDELDHPSFTLENGDGEHAEVTLHLRSA